MSVELTKPWGEPPEHRWSGYPGAFCMNYGAAPDPVEACVAEHETLITCVEGHIMCNQGHTLVDTCADHPAIGPCPGPSYRERFGV